MKLKQRTRLNTFKDLEETGELVIRDGIGYERVKPKYAFLLNTERDYKGGGSGGTGT